MTDKQIIIYKKECYNEPYCSLNQVLEQLKAKEQECEELKKWLPIVTRLEEQFKSHEKAKGISYKTYAEQVFTELDQLKEELAISIQENEEGREINAELKAENDRYKKMLEDEEVILALTEVKTGERHLWYSNAQKLEKTLIEIKKIAEKGHKEKGNLMRTWWFKDILQKCEVLDE